MIGGSGREGPPSSDEGFAEDLHSNNSDSSPQTLLDSLSPASRDAFDAINVVVRVKPTDPSEPSACSRKVGSGAGQAAATGANARRQARASDGNQNDQSDCDLFPADGQIQIMDPQSGTHKSFTFDVIFEPEASQEQVFEHSRLKKFIDMSLEGFASTAFAYGQTGSGKTFTMFGNVFDERRLTDNDKQSETESGNVDNSSKKWSKLSGKKNNNKDHQEPEVVGIVQFTFA